MALHLSPQLAPGPMVAPDCIRCGRPTNLRYTRHSNRTGNAGRPYYKCMPCGKFHCFADQRGNDPTNPPCHCGLSSRRQISSLQKLKGRQIHYVFRVGRCDFYNVHRNPQQESVELGPELAERLARLGII